MEYVVIDKFSTEEETLRRKKILEVINRQIVEENTGKRHSAAAECICSWLEGEDGAENG